MLQPTPNATTTTTIIDPAKMPHDGSPSAGAMKPVVLANYIAGARTAPAAGTPTMPVTTPHSGAVIAHVPLSSASDVRQAVEAAAAAFPAWSARTVKDRVQIVLRYHHLVASKYADELADLIVKEHGKTKAEALAEVAKGNETVEYACALPELVSGRIQEVSRGVLCQDRRVPLGVVATIVPFNFPFMVPHWTLPIALALGNTVVLKPSEKVPLTMTRAAEIWAEAGLPAGVLNLVHGTAETVMALVDAPQVQVVTFVGTSRVAEIVHQRACALNKRVLALGGAKNHLVAVPDCNVTMAAQDIVNSFCGCSGQRCMAASVLLVVGDQPALIDAVVAKARALTEREVGPVIDAASVARIRGYIDDAEKAPGVKVLLDGREWTQRLAPGTFVGPTILLHTNPADRALHDEIFGPVLSILQVPDLATAITIENANPYGNAACIYTSSGHVAEQCAARFQAGMVGVNIGVPVPREPFSFGGWGASRFGDLDITGEGAVELFTHKKKVTSKWTVPAERSWLN
ncbi:methylmalonate-semialdehyde dehydrogenase (acylating) [Allomyces macrogynus ATCC 38327]|uniref:Methylmalonate-semialdehyde dehydrogenase (Acylating) n=1 Tax=Allomyces macrogynus (strain ATCC 38327) TaxID=578462 RepID=A0A0L0T8R9_ALLM3|nr:methylmalonate-semialdehyde dehydrogenase (acylating) [Allomyces macrogynus ATCC 38327]|eukprot:KNE71096.1 methylmalonate-semialdehyde dehydrogenase (acylating) [Allomyces macrogynus ATCC 38327]